MEATGLAELLIRKGCFEMTDSSQQIKDAVKEFILAEFLPGEPADNLEDSTPLIAGAIVDSIGIMKLVLFIQERFGVEIEPHEMNAEILGTIADIVENVSARTPGA
jgi:acyl carrier protein